MNSGDSARQPGVADRVFQAAIWLATLAVFQPLLWTLGRTTLLEEQVQHALLILVIAFAALLRDRSLPMVLAFGRSATRDLMICYIVMAVAILARQPLLALLASCFLVSAAVLFCFGERAVRLAYALMASFGGLLFVIYSLPLFDWPLRLFSGAVSTRLLEALNHRSDLLLHLADPPRLILTMDGHVFEVAAECNGFGIVSGSLLLALLLLVSRPVRVVWKLVALPAVLLAGFTANTLRIIVICLLAPLAGEHYLVMHELVGVTIFCSTLFAIWWFTHRLPVRQSPRR